MKRKMLLFTFLLCVLSCASQKREVIAKSTIKLEGVNTEIRKSLMIDGYFYENAYPRYNCIMFFDDGTWVSFGFVEESTENERVLNLNKYIVNWEEDKQMRWGTYWGVYQKLKDMLIVNFYDKGTFWKGWSFVERKYKIIDKKTLKEICTTNLLNTNNIYFKPKNQEQVAPILHFIPADSLPSSDCWLKEQKWIWRNESDWQKYMERVKQKKAESKKK